MKGKLKKLFWFVSPLKIDEQKNKDLIIHQTLAYGSLEDIKELFKMYSQKEVKRVFLKGQKGLYDPRVVAWLKILLGIKKLDLNNYVKRVY